MKGKRAQCILLWLFIVAFAVACNEDDPPPSRDFSFTIDENYRGGAIIGDVSVVDPQGLSLTYEVVDGEASDLFSVDMSNGALSVRNGVLLQFAEDTSLSLEVEVSNGSAKSTLQITITVLDIEFSYEKYNYIEPTSDQSLGGGWVEYKFSQNDCKCVNGGSFRAAVNDKGSGENLIITLQGGGACWEGLTGCEDIFSSVLPYYLGVAEFSLELENRLGEAWDQVMIPYCDKSLYGGDRTVDYDKDGDLNYFWGFRNSSAAINLAVNQFPNAKRILLTGCSAGGYGTVFNAALVRHYYPDAEILIINESGPGVFNPDDSDTWEKIKDTWSLNIPPDCESCDNQLLSWYDGMMDSDENIRIAQFSSRQDEVIRWFLTMSASALEDHLLSATGELNAKYPDRYKRFVINGEKHCFSSVSERNYSIDGLSYWDWVLAFMNDEAEWIDILE